MKRKFSEWISVQIAKYPGRVVLSAILLFNLLFLLLSTVIISNFSLDGTEDMGFFRAAVCTVTMILDAGCIQFVVEDIGTAGVAVTLICLLIVFVGMITFTGAVIGYITNYISNFIDHANTGKNRLHISDHVVILNWNTRASEIVNDLLYCETPQKVVVLVGGRRAEVEKEIYERLSDTVARENQDLRKQCEARNWGRFRTWLYMRRHTFRRSVTYLVREGDVFSSKQLRDISIASARMIVILGNDVNNTVCKFEHRELLEAQGRGNSQTVKTLMQVADMTADMASADNQKIIVEITDPWTEDLVNRIIRSKQRDEKCKIVPLRIHQVLGQLLSQFSLMPELNLAFRDLLSNKGATFHARKAGKDESEAEFIQGILHSNHSSIPLTVMDVDGQRYEYFSCDSLRDLRRAAEEPEISYKVSLNREYWIERKNVVILGHNSKCRDIMEGFRSFCREWDYRDGGGQILQVVVIDDAKSLEKMNYYREYPFVRTVAADIFDKDLICDTVDKFVSSNAEDTSVLILSDDSALNEDIDANALANLVYVQDIIYRKLEADPNYDSERMDVVVELIDPKHHDVVRSYSVNNVVISNRYISKMITQIGENEALYQFYNDILSYDEITGDAAEDSKEVYIKKVSRFFTEIPKPCKANEFVRAVYAASVDPSVPKEKQCPTLVLGYVKPGGRMTLFCGDLSQIDVVLEERDKLIIFSNH